MSRGPEQPESLYIIISDGQGTRWGDYRGTPKHLTVVEGEVLLARTVKQFLPHGRVVVVGPDDRYHMPGAWLYVPNHKPELSTHEADRFACHREIWPTEGIDRLVLLFGDVWFSNRAVELITGYTGTWTWFSRLGPSKTHGCPYGEGFGFSIAAEFIPVFSEAIDRLIAWKDQGLLHKNQGWQLYRHLANPGLDGRGLRKHMDYGHRVEIDDWTDDFDSPHDIHRWEHARMAAGYPNV